MSAHLFCIVYHVTSVNIQHYSRLHVPHFVYTNVAMVLNLHRPPLGPKKVNIFDSLSEHVVVIVINFSNWTSKWWLLQTGGR